MVLVEVDVKLVFNVIIVKLMGLKVVGVMVQFVIVVSIIRFDKVDENIQFCRNVSNYIVKQ